MSSVPRRLQTPNRLKLVTPLLIGQTPSTAINDAGTFFLTPPLYGSQRSLTGEAAQLPGLVLRGLYGSRKCGLQVPVRPLAGVEKSAA